MADESQILWICLEFCSIFHLLKASFLLSLRYPRAMKPQNLDNPGNLKDMLSLNAKNYQIV